MDATYAYRFTQAGAGPLSRSGHAMFACDVDAVYHYGPVGYRIDLSLATPIESLQEPIIAAWADEDARPVGFESIEADELFPLFVPATIVDSAGAYDCEELTSWFWDRVLDPAGISAIRTPDGAVVFDAELIQPAGSN